MTYDTVKDQDIVPRKADNRANRIIANLTGLKHLFGKPVGANGLAIHKLIGRAIPVAHCP